MAGGLPEASSFGYRPMDRQRNFWHCGSGTAFEAIEKCGLVCIFTLETNVGV